MPSFRLWLLKHPDKLERILFVLFDQETLNAYRGAHEARLKSKG